MSQNMINELTDRVSALTADVARLNRVASDMRGRAHAREAEMMTLADEAQRVIENAERRMYDAMRERDYALRDAELARERADGERSRRLAAEAAGAEVAQTAKGLLEVVVVFQGEDKRLRAEVRDLSSVLTDMIVDKGVSRALARQEVDEIRVEARNNIWP
jgi:hypothetical protein